MLKERGKEILQQADATNKEKIEAQLSKTTKEWDELVAGLEGRRDTLDALSRHWEELDAKWSSLETRLNAIEEKSKLVDTTTRSKQYLEDTLKTLNVSLSRVISFQLENLTIWVLIKINTLLLIGAGG